MYNVKCVLIKTYQKRRVTFKAKSMLAICIFLISFSAFPFTLYTVNEVFASGTGTTGAQFLKLSPSARAAGMGEAYSALAGDSHALFYNPAGIARVEDGEVSLTYYRYFQGINYGSIAGVFPRGERAFGIGIKHLGVTDIPKRSAIDVDDPEGDDGPQGTFGAKDTALTLSYAMPVLNRLNIGASLRCIYQSIDKESAFSVMGDIGTHYSVNQRLSLALNIQNIGIGIKFKDESDPLPLNLKLGASYKLLNSLIVACDINAYVVDRLFYASWGGEYWVGRIGLRAGYKYGYDTESMGASVGLSAGLGLRLNGIGIDYAFVPFGRLGDTHQISISLKL